MAALNPWQPCVFAVSPQTNRGAEAPRKSVALLNHSLIPLRLPQRRLGGGQAGDRHPERRAAHVVHPGLVAEHHAVRVAAVLPADAHLQVLPGLRLPTGPTLLDAHLDQLTYTVHVDRLERVDGQ